MAQLQPIADDIWIVDGPSVSFYGFDYPTRMVVVRLSDGALWVWSPIALEPALKAEITALGPVRWLATPNALHHLFLGAWLDAFPESAAFAAPGLSRKRPDLAFTAEIGAMDQPLPWESEIAHTVLGQGSAMAEVLFFHHASATCLVGDLIQRHDPQAHGMLANAVMKLDGLVGDDGSTPREWRATFFQREAARAALTEAIAWQPERVIIAHGKNALHDGTALLRDNLAWINRSWPA